jgi:hypothetical protein
MIRALILAFALALTGLAQEVPMIGDYKNMTRDEFVKVYGDLLHPDIKAEMVHSKTRVKAAFVMEAAYGAWLKDLGALLETLPQDDPRRTKVAALIMTVSTRAKQVHVCYEAYAKK